MKRNSRVRSISRKMNFLLKGHPYAKAALDMACWDILGKVAGVVFGTCTKCEAGEGQGSLTLEEVLAGPPLSWPLGRREAAEHADGARCGPNMSVLERETVKAHRRR